ncbi:hypothetical protein TrLO_g2424 [Triparma laevis f. longispina]|uniref:Uncharacterized protein n=1 Tax=Triparma laevis f. longispina TaxID=1714387 RepID=A0A9W7FKT2_9STRA|nr:hypothetical protein TrLO_g2424 [Triparma laevis f. longispina]
MSHKRASTQGRRASQPVATLLTPLDKLIQDSKAKRQKEESDVPQKQDATHIWASLDGHAWSLCSLPAPPTPGAPTILITKPDTPGQPLPPDPPITIEVEAGMTHPFDPSHAEDYDDASVINNLHEAPLLYLLLRRFNEQKIYTLCSDVLISVNPYQSIPNIYDDSVVKHVWDEAATKKFKDLTPHVYNVADRSYRTMMKNTGASADSRKNQSVIISGESGAGKTEAAKQVMRYLIEASKMSNGESTEIQDSLISANVILEAFGNAKTLRNDNSSRFGKYIKLMYDKDNSLKGASTEHFLLEKVRLTQGDEGERNYHVFYMLCKSGAEAASLGLSSASDYAMLTKGGCTEVNGVDDAKEFDDLKNALSKIGLSEEEEKDIWKFIALLMHLGNLKFNEADGDGTCSVEVPVGEEKLAALLGCDFLSVKNAITIRQVRSGRGSLMAMNLNTEQAKQGVDALIKHCYGHLFTFLVSKINQSHKLSVASNSFIGILDIFGFEIMKYNSLSQLCINFANEKLQQQFNQQVFVRERELYLEEGLPVDVITFKDNQPVIDLISKKPTGLLPLLEEACMLSRAIEPSALVSSFDKPHAGVHPNYGKARFGNEDFVIKHFAGEVLYSGRQLLSKNNDSLHEDLKILLSNSSSDFIVNVCSQFKKEGASGYVEKTEEEKARNCDERSDELGMRYSALELEKEEARETVAKKRGSAAKTKLAASETVTSKFRGQLNSLVDTLTATEPHYIKCIKPNSSKSPTTANDELVLEQLRYSGVLEVVRIRREGFPIRMSFTDFHKRFEILCFKDGLVSTRKATPEENMAAAIHICGKCLEPTEYAKGKTRMFLRNGLLEKLQQLVNEVYKTMATKLQARQRTKAAVKGFAATKISTVKLQGLQRMIHEKRAFQKHKAATIKAQAFLRCRTEQNQFQKKKAAASKLSAVIRGHQASDGYKKRQSAQAKISAIVRGKQGKAAFDKTKGLVVKLQALERVRERRASYTNKKDTAVKVENIYRMHAQKKEFEGQKAAAVKLQALSRSKQGKDEYDKQQQAALTLHSAMRRFLAMSKLEHKKLGLFSGKKRRQNSVLYKPVGDYIEIKGNAELLAAINQKNEDEDNEIDVKFADNVDKFNRKGKMQVRQIVLTRKFLYLLDGKKIKDSYDLTTESIDGASLSTMADDFVVLHLKGDRDYLLTCQHKTELIECITSTRRTEAKKGFPVDCSDDFKVKTFGSGFSRLKGLETFDCRFLESDEVSAEEKWRVKIVKDGVEISVSTALVSGASHPLGTPRAQKFNIMVGGRKSQAKKSVSGGIVKEGDLGPRKSSGSSVGNMMSRLSSSLKKSEKK